MDGAILALLSMVIEGCDPKRAVLPPGRGRHGSERRKCRYDGGGGSWEWRLWRGPACGVECDLQKGNEHVSSRGRSPSKSFRSLRWCIFSLSHGGSCVAVGGCFGTGRVCLRGAGGKLGGGRTRRRSCGLLLPWASVPWREGPGAAAFSGEKRS